MGLTFQLWGGGYLMPNKPLAPCLNPRCTALTRTGYCDKHKSERTHKPINNNQQLYSWNWRKQSKEFLSNNPFCTICKRKLATEVDHIEPHQGDPSRFWDSTNWQALCKCCHSRKTASEDGGFGNKKKNAIGKDKLNM